VDPIKDLLQRLENAKGDTRAQSALTAEFLVMARPEVEREPLRDCLDAAAILHWFDIELLEKMLEIPRDEAQARLDALVQHSFVEPYRGASDRRFNVHESTRLGWRVKLAGERPKRFRILSARASSCFAGDLSPAGRIEWIYHLLCGEPDCGASQLEELDRQWTGGALPVDRYALATTLQELEDTQLLQGRARAWSLLTIAWTRERRGATAQLRNMSENAVRLAREAKDKFAEADAICLAGRVWQAQGNLTAAQDSFDECLTICRRLVKEHPNRADYQRELAVAHSMVGEVLHAQGALVAAQNKFSESLTISRALAAQSPRNARWQRDLAVAHRKVGGVLQARGKLQAASKSFDDCSTISQELAKREPSNARWQEEVALAYCSVGEVLQAQGQLAAAQAAFDQTLAISRQLAEQDPSNAGWQRELAVAHSRVGDVLQAQGRLEAAQVAFEQDLTISRRLAEQDPSNAGWQRDLALACLRVGRIAAAAQLTNISLALYEESLRIFEALVERAPGYANWAEDKSIVEQELAALKAGVATISDQLK
jgi:tetratricopeptide (TPR) repeat protein